MTKDTNFYLFGGSKWPKNWTYETDILLTSKSTCNEHVKQCWSETSENVLRKWPKTRFFTYFGVLNGPKIGPLGPMFHTPLKVLAMSMRNNTNVKPVHTFWESDHSPQFLLTLGSKMDQKMGLWGPFCTHLWNHDDVIKWKNFPRFWPLVRGIHRSPMNSPHKGQWRGAMMFYLICVWINDLVNTREAGDLRRYRAHYDVNVMHMGARGEETP